MLLCLDTCSYFGYSSPCRSRRGTSSLSLPLSLLMIPSACSQVPRAVALRRHQAQLPPAPGGAQRAAPEEPGRGAGPERRRPGRPGEPPPQQINHLAISACSLSSVMQQDAPSITTHNPICMCVVSVCVCVCAPTLSCASYGMVRTATTTC